MPLVERATDYGCEILSFPFEVKEATERGIVRGYAAAIGNIDNGNDVIAAGAFDRSIRNTRGVVPIFWGHDWSRVPIGYGISAHADLKGLAVAGELTMNIPDVQDAYKSIVHAKKVGFRMGLSIGYRTLDYEMDGDIRLLKEIDVFEWSITPFPMNERAYVSTVKHGRESWPRTVSSASDISIDQIIRRVERANADILRRFDEICRSVRS